MSISENIAKYRKRQGLTQEQLGERLGVTNQSVSKWESAVSMPDIMLLPKITKVLGITLNELYGIADEPYAEKNLNERIDEFGAYTQNLIKTNLYKQFFKDTQAINDLAKIEIGPDNTAKINSSYTIGVIPYTKNGAVFVSDTLSVVSSDFDAKNGSGIFGSTEIASGLRKLCDANVGKVLGYLYTAAFREAPDDLDGLADFFKDNDIFRREFRIDDTAAACGLTEDETLDAVEKLASIHLVSTSIENGQPHYFFEKTRGVEAALTLHAVRAFLRGDMHWGCGYLVGHGTLGAET